MRAGWVLVFRAALLAFLFATPAQSALPFEFILVWGGEGAAPGQFIKPVGVKADASGNVYVAEWGGCRVQKFTSDGVYLTQWGSLGSGEGQFDHPYGIAVDAGNCVYVADAYNNRIQKFTGSGEYITQWGSLGSGEGQFDRPYGVAVDNNGYVYVADGNNCRIQKFTSNGAYLMQWGSLGSGDGHFDRPYGIVADANDNIYVTEHGNFRVQKFTSGGEFITRWGRRGTGDGEFASSWDVGIDPWGFVYVADTYNHRIQVFTSDGEYLAQWGIMGSEDGQFIYPAGIDSDANGFIYVTDMWNHRIQKFMANPVSPPTGLAGSPVYLNNKPVALMLQWNRNPEPRISHYNVYKDSTQYFVPGSGNLLAAPIDTFLYDVQWSWDPNIYYKVSAVDSDGYESFYSLLRNQDVEGVAGLELPKVMYLSQNFPNPFNPMTRIAFELAAPVHVRLAIYDISGRIVRLLIDDVGVEGRNEMFWDGRDSGGRAVASGIYLYQLRANGVTISRKMVLLR